MEVAPVSRDLTRQAFGWYVGVRHLPALHKIGSRAASLGAGKLSSGCNLYAFVPFYAS